MNRRTFLQNSAALSTSLLASGIDRPAAAASARIDAPAVDRIVVREVTDGTHDIFLLGSELPGLTVQRTAMTDAAQGRTLHSEWGLALHIESHRGGEAKQYLLDFGFTPEAYANNLDLLKIDAGPPCLPPAVWNSLTIVPPHFRVPADQAAIEESGTIKWYNAIKGFGSARRVAYP
jgi:hypothetical protein